MSLSSAGGRGSALASHDGADAADRPASALSTGSAVLTVAAVATLFLISSHLLYAWNYDYESPAGPFFRKIHPGTWLAVVALALRSLAGGDPVRFADGVLSRFAGVCTLLATWLLVVVYAAVFAHVPVTPLIDAFALPAILFVLIADLSPIARRRLALLLHAILLANAVLGLVEFETGFRLTPFVEEGVPITDDWRSTALFGHPLTNAAVAGAYILILANAGGSDLPAPVRPVLMALQLAAMVAFGGRTAILILVPLLCCIAAARLWRLRQGGRIDRRGAAWLAFSAPVIAAGIMGLVQAGFFDRFAERFIDDKGSAEARLVILKVLANLSFSDILLGADQARIATIQHLEGIEFGIESFWINFALLYGLAISLLFFVGLIFFFRDMVKEAGWRSLPVIVFLAGIATTAISFSAKTTALGMVVALVLAMLRRETPSREIDPI